MNGIQTDHCAGPRVAAYCLGAGIAMLVSTMAVYAQHPHATQHPHVTQHSNLGCPHGLGHLPGHHAHDCRQGSTPFPYESPSYNDYQHLMRDFETRPPADLGDLRADQADQADPRDGEPGDAANTRLPTGAPAANTGPDLVGHTRSWSEPQRPECEPRGTPLV